MSPPTNEMHPVKRRKLDQPRPFLNKPFRSPLPTAPKLQAETPKDQPHNPVIDTSAKILSSPSVTSADIQKRFLRSPAYASSTYLESASVEFEDLRKHHNALSIRHTQLRQSLETAEHALQVEASGQDVELENLVTKWRKIAQETAEELFLDAKERIDGMGGIAAWRRRAEEESRLWNDYDGKENPTRKDRGDADESQHQEDLRATDQQRPSEPENDEEESSFTMETMLHQMNIDLQAIGFDKQLERWVE